MEGQQKNLNQFISSRVEAKIAFWGFQIIKIFEIGEDKIFRHERIMKVVMKQSIILPNVIPIIYVN